MNIEHELRQYLLLAALVNLFVAPVTFLPGMFFMLSYHAKLVNSLSTGMELFIIGIVSLAWVSRHTTKLAESEKGHVLQDAWTKRKTV